jgi:hypothetical protein
VKKRILIVALIAGLAVCSAFAAFAAANAAVVEHWNIYAASGPRRPFTRFLGPFPDAHTCNVEANEIVRAGGRAYCTSETVLSFDRSRETALIWEFLSAGNPWQRICGRRYSSSSSSPS